MNKNKQIPLVISIIVALSVVGIIGLQYIDNDQEKSVPLTTLQRILDSCETQNPDAVKDLQFNNNTHTINTETCEWMPSPFTIRITDEGIPEIYNKVQTLQDNFDLEKILVNNMINGLIEKYDLGEGLEGLDKNDLQFTKSGELEGSGYLGILEKDSLQVVMHPNSDIVGKQLFSLIESDKSETEFKMELETYDETWLIINFTNPDTEKIEQKLVLYKLFDDHIFASGFYLNDYLDTPLS